MYAMNEKTVRLGLIGKDVSKSDSRRIHTFILREWGYDCAYENFSVSADGFDAAIRTLMGDFDGFNVTIPYKRDVFCYLDEIVGDAFACGAVNTVLTATGTGYNTDGVGFVLMLKGANVEVFEKKILILGAGGSGRSVAAALKKAGASVYMYRRNRQELQEVCAQLGVTPVDNPETGGYDILINTTGVGMHDTEGVSPVSDKAFEGASVAVDLIYKPKRSAFLCQAENLGLRVVNGAAMLFYQAYYSDCLYVKRTPEQAEATALYEKYLTIYGE
jgi:shikimate dehydrogenase